MKSRKRVLAALLALAMLFSMAAISEELPAPEQAGEAAQVVALTEETDESAEEESVEEEAAQEPTEAPVEGPAQEPTEAPIEGPVEEPTEELVEGEPAEEPAAPLPEIAVAPEWEYDAEIGAITIPYAELPETLTFEWSFDGEAAQYAVQTAPVPEGDAEEVRGERVYTNEPRIDLPAADYAEGGWFTLYVTAVLPDGSEAVAEVYFRLERREKAVERIVSAVFNAKCSHEWGWDDETDEGTGICSLCGVECAHKKKNTYDKAILREDISPVQSGSDGCVCYYDIYQYTACKNCGKVVQKKLLRKKVGELRAHDYSIAEDSEVEGNVCRICGYDRSQCPHENRYTYCEVEDEDEAIYYAIDDEAHMVTGQMWLTEYCEDCGFYFYEEEYGYFEHVREDHIYEKGKCIYCKHKIKCSHPKFEYFLGSEEGNDFLYGDIGAYCFNSNAAGYHYRRVYSAVKYCTVCNYSKYVGTKNIKELHVYLPGSTVCVLCGYDGYVKLTGIKFGKAKYTVKRYSMLTLEPTLSPKNASNRTLNWTSSDPSIAIVEDGILKALNNGTVTITCTATDGSEQSASCTVTVEPVPPKSIEIVSIQKKLNIGETLQLHYLLNPDTAESTVKWDSSKPKIAAINPNTGLLTALRKGFTTITAKTSNKKKATVVIEVLDPYELTGVTLSYDYEKVPLNLGETLQLTATLKNEKAQSEIEWVTNNPNVATVEGGLVTPHAEGKVKITARTVAKRSNGSPATASVTIKVNDPYKPTGIKLEQTGTVKLYKGATSQLKAIFEPEGTFSDVKWESNKPKIAKVDANSGLVTGLKVGSATITATAKKNTKLKASVKVSIEKAPNGTFVVEGVQLPLAIPTKDGIVTEITRDGQKTGHIGNWKSDFTGCFAFAEYVYQALFGREMSQDRFNPDCYVTPYGKKIERTAANLKDYTLKAGPGAVIRVSNGNGAGHSMVIVDADQNGAWLYQTVGAGDIFYYDENGFFKYGNKIGYYTWEKWNERGSFTDNGQYIEYIIYPGKHKFS